MRGVLVGLCVCICVAFAAPAFADSHSMGEEKAAEPAKEAVEKQVPTVKAAPPAEAQKPAAADEAAAEALFEAGAAARDEGDYATACEKFQASNDLDPAPGTILNLADCREQLGQLAQAWQFYREAAEKLPAGDERAAYSKEKADELKPLLPRGPYVRRNLVGFVAVKRVKAIKREE